MSTTQDGIKETSSIAKARFFRRPTRLCNPRCGVDARDSTFSTVARLVVSNRYTGITWRSTLFHRQCVHSFLFIGTVYDHSTDSAPRLLYEAILPNCSDVLCRAALLLELRLDQRLDRDFDVLSGRDTRSFPLDVDVQQRATSRMVV